MDFRKDEGRWEAFDANSSDEIVGGNCGDSIVEILFRSEFLPLELKGSGK